MNCMPGVVCDMEHPSRLMDFQLQGKWSDEHCSACFMDNIQNLFPKAYTVSQLNPQGGRVGNKQLHSKRRAFGLVHNMLKFQAARPCLLISHATMWCTGILNGTPGVVCEMERPSFFMDLQLQCETEIQLSNLRLSNCHCKPTRQLTWTMLEASFTFLPWL